MGLIFLVAGVVKLFLPVIIPMIRPGLPDFGQVLAALGMPMPVAMSYVICAVEIGGGVALLLGRCVPLACLVLVGDMVGALVTLSVPATFLGHPLHVGGIALGNEPWRVPLELGLLVALIVLGELWRPSITHYFESRPSA